MMNQENFMNELAASVRKTRKAAGLTQLELADLAGIGKSAVFDIEKGKVNVQLSTLLKVFRVLRIGFTIETPLPASSESASRTTSANKAKDKKQ